jgi:lipopolysaccharide export system protein LptA
MFYQDSNKVVLDGEAVVREGENVIRGERLIFYVDEERTVMEGKKGGQISTTIIPPPKEQGVRGKE